MSRRRLTHRSLTDSRIYPKGKRLYLFTRDALENPNTGKVGRWHSLCKISDGELKARQEAKKVYDHNGKHDGPGDLPDHLEAYRFELVRKKEKDRPREAARIPMFEQGIKELKRACGIIAQAFADFNVDQVRPVDVAKFIDQWEGRRMAQVYKSRLSDFFAWCCRKGLRDDNPCENVTVELPPVRDVYMTDADFHTIRDALVVTKTGRAIPTGVMVQCYIDLCYLLYQRTTEIRLLKWTQIDFAAGVIKFKATKTEKSSGAEVGIPITPAIAEVLERARLANGVKSFYVIHTNKGKPYTAGGLGSAWDRAKERAGVTADLTMKDIRSKASTDADKAGYTLEQIQVGLAHTDPKMTKHYIRNSDAPVSEVLMVLPAKAN